MPQTELATFLRTALAATALLALVPAVRAADEPPAAGAPASDQVVVPEVERREVKLPRFPSKDFSVGLLAGVYNTQNFGSSSVTGLRLGYHITEDFFVEAAFAKTKVSDDNYRQILPGGIFPDRTETLSYYNLSAGYNVLPGEVFIGRNRALASALYVIGGVGTTRFFEQRRQTLNVGVGLRVLLWDRFAIQFDARDHIFSLDLLGKRKSTQNPELTGGLTVYF